MSINQFNTELMQLMHKHGVRKVTADDYKTDVVMRHSSDVQSSDSNPLLFGKAAKCADNELLVIGDVTTETIDEYGVYSVTSGERLPTFPYYGNSRQRRKIEAEKHNSQFEAKNE